MDLMVVQIIWSMHVNVKIIKHIRICALVVALDYSIAEVQQKMVHVIQISVQFIYFCEKHSKFFLEMSGEHAITCCNFLVLVRVKAKELIVHVYIFLILWCTSYICTYRLIKLPRWASNRILVYKEYFMHSLCVVLVHECTYAGICIHSFSSKLISLIYNYRYILLFDIV